MTVDETRALIAEVRQEESIQDKLGDGFGEGSEERAFYYGHLDRYKRLADALEAATRERDAALAAIERIRRAVAGHPECDRYEEGDVISCGWKSAYASVVAALDGAPEPEWEYGLGNRKSPRDAGIPYLDEAHVRWLASALEETPTFGPQLVRRRKAGPWLPVEGESNE